MVMMIARRLRRRRREVRRRNVSLTRRFQQSCAATGAKVISLAIGGSTSGTRLAASAFGFSVHIHGFFRTLLQRESLHRLEERGLVFRPQLGITHAVSEFPLRTISLILTDGVNRVLIGFLCALCDSFAPFAVKSFDCKGRKGRNPEVAPPNRFEPTDWKTPPSPLRRLELRCSGRDDNARIALRRESCGLRSARRSPESADYARGRRSQ